MTNFALTATRRIEGYLGNYDTDQPAEILADLLHYCTVKGWDFQEQLGIAEGYVEEELAVDTVSRP